VGERGGQGVLGVHEQERDREPLGRLLSIDAGLLIGFDREGIVVVGHGTAGGAVVLEGLP
jgi:hypothetical protein